MDVEYITGKLREWRKEAGREYDKIRSTTSPLIYEWCCLAGKLDDAYEAAKHLIDAIDRKRHVDSVNETWPYGG